MIVDRLCYLNAFTDAYYSSENNIIIIVVYGGFDLYT